MRFVGKIKEVGIATLAINVLIWLLVAVKIVPFNSSLMLAFGLASLLLVLGQAVFIVGAEDSIMQMGQKIGKNLGKVKGIILIFLIGFAMGAGATMAEPDIMFFVEQLVGFCPNLGQTVIMLGLAGSIGLFVVVSLIQTLKRIPLKYIFLVLYALSIILCLIFSNNYFGIAFDASGVTTGPITVPLLIAFGSGFSAITARTENNSGGFGMVGMASVGPILLMSFFGLFGVTAENYVTGVTNVGFFDILLHSAQKSAIALVPIVIIFLILNLSVLKLSVKTLIKMFVSLIVCYVGLVVFLTAINYGFAPMGNFLGQCFGEMAGSSGGMVILLIIMAVMGFVLVFTEPAINILASQITVASVGKIKKSGVYCALIIAISLALILSTIRVVFAIPAYWFIIPLLLAIIVLSFVVPEIFVGIAFDSGGVASGSMAVAFVFPIFVGIANSVGVSVLSYAFGTIALIALLPVLCIQALGLVSKIKQRRMKND